MNFQSQFTTTPGQMHTSSHKMTENRCASRVLVSAPWFSLCTCFGTYTSATLAPAPPGTFLGNYFFILGGLIFLLNIVFQVFCSMFRITQILNIEHLFFPGPIHLYRRIWLKNAVLVEQTDLLHKPTSACGTFIHTPCR